jgi:hypothetical protein
MQWSEWIPPIIHANIAYQHTIQQHDTSQHILFLHSRRFFHQHQLIVPDPIGCTNAVGRQQKGGGRGRQEERRGEERGGNVSQNPIEKIIQFFDTLDAYSTFSTYMYSFGSNTRWW